MRGWKDKEMRSWGINDIKLGGIFNDLKGGMIK